MHAQQQALLVAALVVAGEGADALEQLGFALGHLLEGVEGPDGEAARGGDFQGEDAAPQLLHGVMLMSSASCRKRVSQSLSISPPAAVSSQWRAPSP